jgi:PqqD family protein of HPr-rel-A system
MSAERPTKAPGLEAHEVDDGLVVYQGVSDRVHYLNATAAVVYELCDGKHSEEEIVALVGEAWDLDEPPRQEVETCLEQLRAEGVVV